MQTLDINSVINMSLYHSTIPLTSCTKYTPFACLYFKPLGSLLKLIPKPTFSHYMCIYP